MLAIDLVGTFIVPLSASDTLQYARVRMQELGVRHLPVVDQEQLTGLISMAAIDEENDLSQMVSSLRRPQPSFVFTYQHVFDVLSLMQIQQLSLVPVLDQNQHYLGALLQPALLDYCSKLLSASQPGGIIILEVNERDLSLAELAKIAEANDTQILSYLTETAVDPGRVKLTLKLNKTDITAVIATFERFNYQVKQSFQEDNFKDDTTSRYESLMNYLNM